MLEVSVFISFVERFGLFLGFFEIIVTVIFGFRLMSARPMVAIQKFQQQLAAGVGNPRHILYSGVRRLIAGFFLILPGFVSDVVGLWLWLSSVIKEKGGNLGPNHWNENNSSGKSATNDFDEAWRSDEFSERIKGKPSTVGSSDIVDATIISTDESNESKDKG